MFNLSFSVFIPSLYNPDHCRGPLIVILVPLFHFSFSSFSYFPLWIVSLSIHPLSIYQSFLLSLYPFIYLSIIPFTHSFLISFILLLFHFHINLSIFLLYSFIASYYTHTSFICLSLSIYPSLSIPYLFTL
jgi:hypothetical protein